MIAKIVEWIKSKFTWRFVLVQIADFIFVVMVIGMFGGFIPKVVAYIYIGAYIAYCVIKKAIQLYHDFRYGKYRFEEMMNKVKEKDGK